MHERFLLLKPETKPGEPKRRGYVLVRAIWDERARVWSASSTGVEGLAVEAETIEDLERKALDAIAVLLEIRA